MKNSLALICIFSCSLSLFAQAQQLRPADKVNPFIGTTNYGTCNPGAICPNGMMSVIPFNVMGSDLNRSTSGCPCRSGWSLSPSR